MVSHRITKIRCVNCGENYQEYFKNKKHWVYDPLYPVNILFSNIMIMSMEKWLEIKSNKKHRT